MEKVAEAIGADPELRRRTGQGAPVVLLLPHGAMGGLELPRALSDRTRATVWAATSDVRLVPGRNNGHRIALMRQELAGTDNSLPGEWLRTEPGDAGPGGVRAGERSGEPGYLQLPNGGRVWDTEVRSRPVIDRRDHRPRGRSTLAADDRTQLYIPFLPGVGSYTRRSSLWDHRPFQGSFGSEPLPHLNHGADAYHADGHGEAGAVEVALRDGGTVDVAGEEWGRYLMRRPSFRRLPPTSPVVMWNCSAAAPPHRSYLERYPELTSAAVGLAKATGRIVYGADGVVTLGFDRGGQVYTVVKASGWPPGEWRRVRPEARTEELAWEVAGEVRGDIVFGGGSSRLSPEAREVIEELAARTVRDSVAALDKGRPVPVVTITGHSNGTWFDQSRSGLALRSAQERARALRETALRSGQERADAVALAFATAFLRGLRQKLEAAGRLGEYLAAAAAQGGAVLDGYGFPGAVMSRGRAYPPVNPRPEDGTARLPERGPDARRRAVITIRNFRRAAEPEATQLSGDADAGSEQADAGQGASQLHIAAHQAQGPQVETHTVPPADAPGVLQQVVVDVSGRPRPGRPRPGRPPGPTPTGQTPTGRQTQTALVPTGPAPTAR